MGEKRSGIFKYMKYSTVGIELSLSIIIGGGIGYWLDQELGTEPGLLIFWLSCGMIAGFRSLYRTTKRIMKEIDENEDHGSD